MRYVQKKETPQFFKKSSNGARDWSEYRGSKRVLRQYILQNEQNYLCIYCESKISEDSNSSHLEHIKPKHLDIDALTFDYANIAVSCNGNGHIVDNRKHYSCGHYKDKENTPFEETKFLNPVKIETIRDYFAYDIDEGRMMPSDKDTIKADYMIETLGLNEGHSGLKEARKKALKAFIKELNTIEDVEQRQKRIRVELQKEKRAFISFLRYRFQKFL